MECARYVSIFEIYDYAQWKGEGADTMEATPDL